jgi:hypothetical protein
VFSPNPLQMPVLLFGDHEDRVEQGLRPRNFLRSPRAIANPQKGETNEAFSAGGILIEIANSTGIANETARTKLFELMALLEERMAGAPSGGGELWLSPLVVPAQNPAEAGQNQMPHGNAVDNPSIPSGYTYLLQFIAHDLVDTVRAMSLAKPGGTPVATPVFRNARKRPLMLDTLYGDGPDENPQPFETTNATNVLPRTLLRTGPIAPARLDPVEQQDSPPEPRQFCPFVDIARSSAPQKAGELPSPPAAEGRPRPPRPPLTEAHVADPRNDSHALVSQLTVLFHLLHNTIMEATPLPDGIENPFDMSAENAYRRFTCARLATTLIYRNIVERDVLSRILDKTVYDAYRSSDKLPLDDAADVPAEFFAGAFRFGHAMVRNAYFTNHSFENPAPFSGALRLGSRGKDAPVPKKWAIDWSLFFGSPGPNGHFNFSRRIGPWVSDGLLEEGSKVPGVGIHGFSFSDRGLPSRDLLTSSYSGLWSVPALFKAITKLLNERGLGDLNLLPAYSVWEGPLRRWLKASVPELFTSTQLDQLVSDPPLPFFVQFESAHEVDGQGRPIAAAEQTPGQFPGQGGRTLGRFGSILVADPIFNALRSKPFGAVRTGASLRDQIGDICQALVGDRGAFDTITAHELNTMPQLLALLKERGKFA